MFVLQFVSMKIVIVNFMQFRLCTEWPYVRFVSVYFMMCISPTKSEHTNVSVNWGLYFLSLSFSPSVYSLLNISGSCTKINSEIWNSQAETGCNLGWKGGKSQATTKSHYNLYTNTVNIHSAWNLAHIFGHVSM